jgi:5-methyltetrahydropteroyltriglutamate--homocysteine methyltransferase
MRRSTDRIIVSHAGTLPRTDDLRAMMQDPNRADEFTKALPAAVKEVVRKQVEVGIDVVNDGELGKRDGFSSYPRSRISGIEVREFAPGEGPKPHDVQGRDRISFPEFGKLGFPARPGGAPTGGNQAQPGAQGGGTVAAPGGRRAMVFCTGPITYIGKQHYEEDIRNLKAAVDGLDVEAYLPAVAPGTMEHWLRNEYYKTDEEMLYAIAEAMKEEYKAIIDAGFVLQIDDPDLPDGWQMYPEMSIEEYHKYAQVRIEALNHGLAGLPEDRIRFHTCWGSQHGPHMDDIELKHIVDLVLMVRAECISVEAANPQHDHDWKLWETVKLPEGKSYMPGVVSHVSNHIEHPELVAQRLIRYANVMGKENVIAGTDCGMGSRVGHPEVAWAKFKAMAEGARIATKELWGK